MDAWAQPSETAIDAKTSKSRKGEEMEEINRARAKITDESQKIGGPLAIFIEEHVNSLCTTADVAAKIMDKNLKDLIKEIENEARKNKTGNVGAVSDADVIAMAEDFYGIGAAARKSRTADVIDVFDLI